MKGVSSRGRPIPFGRGAGRTDRFARTLPREGRRLPHTALKTRETVNLISRDGIHHAKRGRPPDLPGAKERPP